MSDKINTEQLVSELKTAIADFEHEADLSYIGYVISVADGIAKVRGLTRARYGECVTFDSGVKGLVSDMNTAYISVVLLSNNTDVSEGSEVRSTREIMSIPASMDMVGRIVDIFGNPIDGKETNGKEDTIETEIYMPLERDAPGVLDRKSIHQPCPTGVKIIDAFIPIGKGQREMIIGDRLTGKTSLVIDMILNQKHLRDRGEKIFCIYVAIGQKASKIAQLKQLLEEKGAMEYTIIVAATAGEPAAYQVLAPFAGCALGEYFRDKGMHAIVVYDDLSKHAVAHRQVALLLRQPPGREAYPGDIFYLHSRLLERAAKLNDALGGGSLTAIPIIETQEGNFATYVPTNVWSITDGQIVLNTDYFLAGQRPAVDVGLSVSRVGGEAQIGAIKSAASLKLMLAQYQEYKTFAQYGAELDANTQMILNTGKRLMEAFKQVDGKPLTQEETAIFLQACVKGYIGALPVETIAEFESTLIKTLHVEYPDIIEQLEKTGKIDDKLEYRVDKLLAQVSQKFAPTAESV